MISGIKALEQSGELRQTWKALLRRMEVQMGLFDALLPLSGQGHHVHAKIKLRAKGDRTVAKKLFLQLDPQVVRYEGDRLRILVKPYHFIKVQLK